MLIKDCLFDTGDDCIALKSGRNSDVRLEQCVFDRVKSPDVLENIRGLKLTGVTVNGKAAG